MAKTLRFKFVAEQALRIDCPNLYQ